MRQKYKFLKVTIAILLFALLTPIFSQVLSNFKAITTKDPEIPLDELKLLVEPMTVGELKVEADAWFRLLRKIVQDITDVEVGVKQKNRALAKKKEAIKVLKDAQDSLQEAQNKEQTQTIDTKNEKEIKEKKLEADQALKKAQESLKEAQKTEENLKKDKTIKKAIDYATKREEENGKDSKKEEQAKKKNEKEIKKITKELSSKKLNSQEGKKLQEVTKKLEDTIDHSDTIKKKLLTSLTELQAYKSALIDRLNVVLDELEEKGGKELAIVKTYRAYVKAIMGINVDVSDTEGLWVRFSVWLTSEKGAISWFIDISIFVAILLVTILLSRLISLATNRILKNKISDLMLSFTTNAIRKIGFVIGVMVGLSLLNVNLAPIFALVGGASFVLAFALQSNLGNLASGIMIMIYKPFDLGDEVVVDGQWVWIKAITLANTQVEGFSGQIITIPNNSIWNNQIVNYTHADVRKEKIRLNIKFSQDIDRVEQIVLDIAKQHPKVTHATTFPWNYGEYYFMLDFYFSAKTSEFWDVWSEINRELQRRLEKENIEIAIPQRDIQITQK
ncbi:MAG: mechanosensitive ion channel domain-containing protein [Spirochaetota bacterium]